jgi:hypothetical protein
LPGNERSAKPGDKYPGLPRSGGTAPSTLLIPIKQIKTEAGIPLIDIGTTKLSPASRPLPGSKKRYQDGCEPQEANFARLGVLGEWPVAPPPHFWPSGLADAENP